MALRISKKRSFQRMVAPPIANRVIGKIRIFGPIMPVSSRSRQIRGVNPDKVAQKVAWAQSHGIKNLIFEINSPGGAVVPSKEIAETIQNARMNTVAWVRDLAASGGYWIASACDRIVADSMSGIGSIGVISAYLEFSELFKKYGIGYEGFKSGEYKDLGIPFRKPTKKERAVVQEHIDNIHEKFVESVAENRGLDKGKISKLATGQLYLGEEALKLGLVDIIGGRQEAVRQCEKAGRFKHLFVTDIEDFREELFSQLQSFLAMFPSAVGRGISDSLFERIAQEGMSPRNWRNGIF